MPTRPKHFLALLLLVCVVANGPATAEQHAFLEIADAVRQYRLGNEKAATPTLTKYAKLGYDDASFALATMYWTGSGVSRSSTRAQQYFKDAASKGNIYAALALTSICVEISDNGKDECARKWLNRAHQIEIERYYRLSSARDRLAEPFPPAVRTPLIGDWLKTQSSTSTNPKVRYFLALLHETGYSPNVPINGRRSAELMLAAANDGLPIAQTFVGELLIRGHRIEQNAQRALEWYHAASMQGFSPAKYRLGTMLISWPEGIEHDPKRGRRLLEQAAAADVTQANYVLGNFLIFGTGIPKDIEKGVAYLEDAAQRGSTAAHGLLGLLYYDSNLVPRSDERALRHLRHSAQDEIARAQVAMAEVLAFSREVTPAVPEAYMWTYFSLQNLHKDLTGDTKEWADTVQARIRRKMNSTDLKKAEQLIEKREHAISYVRTRTSWCVRANGTLCDY